ncbi:MAG TPA: S4 domain-containing protein YaaA [Pseudogracilibacillus sp.]|nr:S4 domain-containing protein YaaA [Pseudogracilibacillus sp.]
MNKETIYIDTPYITLGQLLKVANVFDTGGMIKHYLQDHGALVNDEKEHRRGRKLYEGDVVVVEGMQLVVERRQ